MTPAVLALKKAKIPYRLLSYEHDASSESYGQEAVDKLGVDAERVFKTLVVETTQKQLVVAVIPVCCTLSLKKLALVLDVKKVKMADKARVQASTGYVLGGVSPVGQKKPLLTVIDSSAQSQEHVLVSAGQRGLELELSGHDLCHLTSAKVADIRL